MLLNIVTPNKKLVVDETISEVIIPANRGELTLYEGHSPLITTLDIGVLKYKTNTSTDYKEFAVSWGYCEVAGNTIQVLAEVAESSDEIDKERSEASLKKAQSQIDNYKDLSVEELNKSMEKLKKAQTRLSIIK